MPFALVQYKLALWHLASPARSGAILSQELSDRIYRHQRTGLVQLPTDVESWRRIVRICKAHGLNHIRFHSRWCPPKAAFEAADELGFYYQVEASAWANEGHRSAAAGRLTHGWRKSRNAFWRRLWKPSIVLMMAYGNEPSGKNDKKWLQEWVARRKQDDPRRFYTTGAGRPVMRAATTTALQIHASSAGARAMNRTSTTSLHTRISIGRTS